MGAEDPTRSQPATDSGQSANEPLWPGLKRIPAEARLPGLTLPMGSDWQPITSGPVLDAEVPAPRRDVPTNRPALPGQAAAGSLRIDGEHPLGTPADRRLLIPSRTHPLAHQLYRECHMYPDQDRMVARGIEILQRSGLEPVDIPGGGFYCDVGTAAAEGWIGIRADLDPLPLQEKTGVWYASKLKELMQACGHDVHYVALLITALELQDMHLKGAVFPGVRFMAQRDEEIGKGALVLRRGGALAGVSHVAALHCNPKLRAGTVAVVDGTANWACDNVDITVYGPGGHTARPHETVDMTYTMAKLLVELKAAMQSSVPPGQRPPNLTFGRTEAGIRRNVIPDSGMLAGTLRCERYDTWLTAEDLLAKNIEKILMSTGATYNLEYEQLIPPVVNDPRAVERFRVAAQALGILVDPTPMEGGDDLAWLLEEVTGVYGQLGTWSGEGEIFDIHNSRYRPELEAIDTGVRFFLSYIQASPSGYALAG